MFFLSKRRRDQRVLSRRHNIYISYVTTNQHLRQTMLIAYTIAVIDSEKKIAPPFNSLLPAKLSGPHFVTYLTSYK